MCLDGRNNYEVKTLLDVMLKIIYRSISHFQHLRVINMISDELERRSTPRWKTNSCFYVFSGEESGLLPQCHPFKCSVD